MIKNPSKGNVHVSLSNSVKTNNHIQKRFAMRQNITTRWSCYWKKLKVSYYIRMSQRIGRTRYVNVNNKENCVSDSICSKVFILTSPPQVNLERTQQCWSYGYIYPADVKIKQACRKTEKLCTGLCDIQYAVKPSSRNNKLGALCGLK